MGQKVYKLRVVLRGVSPLIWRHLLVPSEISLAALHQTLQVAFGWSDTHLHEVRIQARDFGSLGHDPGAVKLSDFRLRPRETFSYVYNFTDNWEWQVRLLEMMPAEGGKRYPVCVGGRRAAPPEGCGGPQAYLRRLDDHHLPLDALGVLAHALERVLAADEGQLVRDVVGDLDEIEDAVRCVDAYEAFQPDRFSRRELNARLRSLAVEGRLA